MSTSPRGSPRPRPDLLSVHGVGPETAAQLLITCGDNPDRLTCAAVFAALCGAAPLRHPAARPPGTGSTAAAIGQANRALYVIAITRMARCPRTRGYVTRRTAEGKTQKKRSSAA